MEKTMEKEKTIAATTEATGAEYFRAKLITHLSQAEIEVVDRLLDVTLDATLTDNR